MKKRFAVLALALFGSALYAQQIQPPPVQVPQTVTPPPVSIQLSVSGLPAGCKWTQTTSGTSIVVNITPGTCTGTVPPPCNPPNTMVNGVCTPPGPPCNPPNTLVNGVCTPPTQNGRTKLTPSGGDDGPAIKAAAGKGPIELSCGSSCTFSLSSTSLLANSDIWVDDGVTVSDRSGYGSYDQMFAVTVANAKIAGSGTPTAGLLTMPNSYSKNVNDSDTNTNQYNNCIWSNGATNFSYTGLRFDKCGGDNVYITGNSSGVVRGNVGTNPIRNGFSVTGSNGVTVDGNDFSGSVHCATIDICNSGDVEPNNPSSSVKGLVITNNKFHDNGGVGLCLCFFFINSSTGIDITVSNNTASNNAGSVNGHPPTGNKGFMADSWPSPLNGSVNGSGNKDNGRPVSFPN